MTGKSLFRQIYLTLVVSRTAIAHSRLVSNSDHTVSGCIIDGPTSAAMWGSTIVFGIDGSRFKS